MKTCCYTRTHYADSVKINFVGTSYLFGAHSEKVTNTHFIVFDLLQWEIESTERGCAFCYTIDAISLYNYFFVYGVVSPVKYTI
jgi:hypothetical protein